jgi:hypothetical protein
VRALAQRLGLVAQRVGVFDGVVAQLAGQAAGDDLLGRPLVDAPWSASARSNASAWSNRGRRPDSSAMAQPARAAMPVLEPVRSAIASP